MGKLFAFFFAIASVFIVYAISNQFQMSQRMVSTKGEIKNTPETFKDIYVRLGFNRSSPIGRSYIVDVAYKYSVDGRLFEGNQLRIDGNQYLFKGNAEKVVKMLKTYKNVTVWYDPLQPSRSVLIEPGIQMNALIGLLGCLLLSFISYRYLDKAILYLGRFKRQA